MSNHIAILFSSFNQCGCTKCHDQWRSWRRNGWIHNGRSGSDQHNWWTGFGHLHIQVKRKSAISKAKFTYAYFRRFKWYQSRKLVLNYILFINIYAFSFDDIVVPEEGMAATVVISMENFVSYTYERMIYAENMVEELLDWQVSNALLHLRFLFCKKIKILDCIHTNISGKKLQLPSLLILPRTRCELFWPGRPPRTWTSWPSRWTSNRT